MNFYLKEAGRLARLHGMPLSEKDVSEIRQAAYRYKIRDIIFRAGEEIERGSLRVPERMIRRARTIAREAGIDIDKEFGEQLTQLETKLDKIRH